MLRRKFVRQENLKDCGAACLLMIMRHYGGNYPLEQLRELMKMDKNGTTAYNLIQAAKQVGFDARGYRCNNYQDINCPSIGHVILNKTYHHYVVIENVDIKNKKIMIIDPALGQKKYSFDEFDQIWTHVIITLYPTRKIDNINVIKNVEKTMYKLIKPYSKLFIFIFALSVIFTAFNIVDTLYFKIIIDHTSLSTTTYFYLFIFFLFITISKIMIDFIRNELLIYIDRKIDKSLMENTFKHLLALPWQYFNSRTTGDIVSRINDLGYVRELISKASIIVLVDFVLVVGSIIVMWFINHSLFLITILIFLTYFTIFYLFNRSIRYFIIKNQEIEAVVSSSFIETLTGINTIKNLGIEKQAYRKAMTKYNDLIDNNYSFNRKYNMIKAFKDSIAGVGLLITIFIGSIFISQGLLAISDFIMFNFFLNFFLEPMKNIFNVEPLLRASSNAVVRISEFYNIEEDKPDGIKEISGGNLALNNLSFAYNGKDEVISDINININRGEKVIISGPSGSGKSTIIKMLMRYLDVKPNQIMIDGRDVLSYSLSTIRNNICYVSQDEMIFTDSLYNNVILGRDIKDDKISEILDLSCINDVLNKHNLDCYMLLEENGANISGGERQRIIIARALIKQSKIYIFDESMSEMNISLERNLLQNMFNNYNDKTFIVISHRLDNADLFDRVITINNLKKQERNG